MDYDIFDHIHYLEIEISQLQSMIKPHDTGHIHSTIAVLEARLYVLWEQIGLQRDDLVGKG